MSETLETIINDPRTPAEYKIAKLGPWFHNLHLPDGTQTAPNHPLGDFPAYKWDVIQSYLPEDMTGWRVLDIGCNAGYYSFEMAKRGASVTGIDIDNHYLKQARWAMGQYNIKNRVVFRRMQVYELMKTRAAYDLILFLGVFYHLRYPLLALDIVAQKFKRMMVFQSLTMPGEGVYETPEDLPIGDREEMLNPGWPKMAFIENSLAGDKTNWWAPNHAAIEAMMRSAGLRITSRPGHEFYICEHAAETENDELKNMQTASRALQAMQT